jgi:hypothetical protein
LWGGVGCPCVLLDWLFHLFTGNATHSRRKFGQTQTGLRTEQYFFACGICMHMHAIVSMHHSHFPAHGMCTSAPRPPATTYWRVGYASDIDRIVANPPLPPTQHVWQRLFFLHRHAYAVSWPALSHSLCTSGPRFQT